MSDDVLKSEQTKQVAIRVLSRESERDIATAMGLTHKQVYRIKHTEEYEKAIKELAEEKTRELLFSWKKRLEAADKPAWEAFMFNLKDKKSMEAVKEYLNMIGFRAKEDKETDGPVVQLIMPGASVPDVRQVIDVIPEDPDKSGAV